MSNSDSDTQVEVDKWSDGANTTTVWWVCYLNKSEVIAEFKKREIQVDETLKLDKLCKALAKVVRTENFNVNVEITQCKTADDSAALDVKTDVESVQQRVITIQNPRIAKIPKTKPCRRRTS